MMTSKDRKGPKPSKQFKVVEESSNPAQPPKPMSNQPKRLHIYKPEDVRGNITGPFIRLTLGYKNHFLGLEVNERFIGISLIFKHIVFSFKPQ
jgi:hypothetical protein